MNAQNYKAEEHELISLKARLEDAVVQLVDAAPSEKRRLDSFRIELIRDITKREAKMKKRRDNARQCKYFMEYYRGELST